MQTRLPNLAAGHKLFSLLVQRSALAFFMHLPFWQEQAGLCERAVQNLASDRSRQPEWKSWSAVSVRYGSRVRSGPQIRPHALCGYVQSCEIEPKQHRNHLRTNEILGSAMLAALSRHGAESQIA